MTFFLHSQAEHFATVKGLVEISGSPTLVSTTELLHCTTPVCLVSVRQTPGGQGVLIREVST